MEVKDILAANPKQVISIRPDQVIRDATGLMAGNNIGALVVLDDAGQLVGIISMRDIIRTETERTALLNLPVKEVMTQNVVTGKLTDNIEDVLKTMIKGKFRHLPIMDGNKLVGIVSMRDVVGAIYQN